MGDKAKISDEPLLQLEAMIGFNGVVQNGLHVHPDRGHFVYPVGCTVVVEDIENKTQQFLSGHTDLVTCVAISRNGRYIASGQRTYMGFKADVILWDFKARSLYATLTLHKVTVQALAFSPNDMYLATLGGPDDGSVVVWNILTKQAVCGSPVAAYTKKAGRTKLVAFTNNSDTTFVTGGADTLRVWELDLPNRKIRPNDVKMAHYVMRDVNCVEFDAKDEFFLCGTTTGDIMAVKLSTNTFQKLGPAKKLFSQGITALKILPSGDLLVGAGDGTIAVCKGHDEDYKRTQRSAQVEGGVTSIALRGKGDQFFIGTSSSDIHRVPLSIGKNDGTSLKPELIKTCHSGPVNDICFPKDCSILCVTCSKGDIRVWFLPWNKEQLRIKVKNGTCNAVIILPQGEMILSAWDDGRIIAFYPESGREMFVIEDAHKGGVSALAAGPDQNTIISGGKEGKVRVWVYSAFLNNKKQFVFTTKLIGLLTEHKDQVTAIHVRKLARQCVTSCNDGSCIVWDLEKMCRMQMIRVNTLFKHVCYHPREHQIITAGADHKIGYYETFDASNIRALDASTAAINTLDVSKCGNYFVSAGDDKLVKVWKYNEGETTHIGVGHSGAIMCAKISDDSKHIISVSQDGAILRWAFPH